MSISSFSHSSPSDVNYVWSSLSPAGKLKAVSGGLLVVAAVTLCALGSLVLPVALAVGGVALLVLGLCDHRRSEKQSLIPLEDVLSNEQLMKSRGFRPYSDEDGHFIEVVGVPHPFERKFNFLTLFPWSK